MAIRATLDTANSIGVSLGLPNFDNEYPEYIKDLFKQYGFKGDDLESRTLKFGQNLISTMVTGADYADFKANIVSSFNRSLMTKPVMQCRDYRGYRGIAVHIRGKTESEKNIFLKAENARTPFEHISSFWDLFALKALHSGLTISLSKLEIIGYIFKNSTELHILDREQNLCLQNTISPRQASQEIVILEDDVSPLFEKNAHLSEDLLYKLFTGTHPDLQLGNDPKFKLFEADSDFDILEDTSKHFT